MAQENIHLRALVNVAISDMHLAEEERKLIYAIAKLHGVERSVVDNMINNPAPLGSVDALSEEEKFELLYNIVQLMKIDRKVYVSEVKYCEQVASALGFDKKVIQELSSKIYANPSITTDRGHLKNLVEKHRSS